MKIFHKLLEDCLMVTVLYLMKLEKIKKFYFEVILNTKILYIILFDEMANNLDFSKFIKELDKGGD